MGESNGGFEAPLLCFGFLTVLGGWHMDTEGTSLKKSGSVLGGSPLEDDDDDKDDEEEAAAAAVSSAEGTGGNSEDKGGRI